VNRVTLFGHLGRSPKGRVGNRSVHFSLAVKDPYRNAAGDKVERTIWFHCTAWDELGERVMKYLHRGDQALVEGRIELREFQGRDGTPRAMLSVTAFRVEFGSKARREEVADSASAPATMGVEADDAAAFEDFAADDEQDPF
jgi:single-strand DNA-binding protein